MSLHDYNPTIWTRADALRAQFDNPVTTMPVVSKDFPLMSDKLFIWDTMTLRTMDGTIVSIDGWSVIFTLTAIRSPNLFTDAQGKYNITADWENRHERARICFWYSRTGKDWIYGGRVMADGVSPTSREWAGTPILLNNDGEVDLYYTCVNPGAAIVKVRGKLLTSDSGVTVTGFSKVKTLFGADGLYYQTEKQNPYFNFRDPSPFIDPKDGKLYMVFEGNVAGKRGIHRVGKRELGFVPPDHTYVGGSKYQVGCIGIAVAKDLNGDDWELLPPLITAVGVNDQTERPHYVFKDNKYYLFTISHKFTYAEGLSGPDGVYGFVSDSLGGPYKPMNSSGLVLGNPSAQPYQTYSHCVMSNGLVTSFIDSVPVPRVNPSDLPYRIGGTEAPTVRLEFKDDKSYLVEVLDYGYIPAMQDIKLKKKI